MDIATIVPHHPDQMIAFEAMPVDATYGPLTLNLVVSLHRVPRLKCSSCAKRRVGFAIGLGDVIASAPLCAKCAGIR